MSYLMGEQASTVKKKGSMQDGEDLINLKVKKGLKQRPAQIHDTDQSEQNDLEIWKGQGTTNISF